jgi:orotate phosphoribosyltransferase
MTEIYTSTQLIEDLLKIGVIQINTEEFFIFASGVKSPIYTDGRLTISHPKIRNKIAQTFAQNIRQNFPEVEYICGVATGSIAISALVAGELNLPLIYWRKPKGYGHNKTIEGDYKENKKIIVIEDVVSTGGSSLKAVKDIQAKNGNVLKVLVMYSHALNTSLKNYAEHGVTYQAMATLDDILKYLETHSDFSEEKVEIIKNWQKEQNKPS